MKKKTILILICFIITLYILSSHGNFYLIKFQKIQLKLTQDFIFNIKKINNFYWIVIIFLYGIVHSLGPGHGKTLLATNCLNYKKSNIFLLAAFISYTQGFICFFFISSKFIRLSAIFFHNNFYYVYWCILYFGTIFNSF